MPVAALYWSRINSQAGGLGGGKGKSGMFGMMAAQELKPQTSDKTFDDVKGCVEAKAELQEIADYLADPEKFTTLGGKLPKGVLLSHANVVAAVLEGRTERKCTVELPGGPLEIEWRESDNRVIMTGPAELVFDGVVAV